MLKGKVVKVRNPQLLQFLYPEAVLRSELSFLDRDKFVIYTGESHGQIRKWLGDRTKMFISTVGPYDVDLTKPQELVKFVFTSRGKEPSKKILDLVKNLEEDMDLVEYMCKVYWVTGRWYLKTDDTDVTMYNLFDAVTKTKKDTLNVYFALREVYPYAIISAGFLTFLVKAKNPENYLDSDSISSGYKQVIKSANGKFGNKILGFMNSLGKDDSEANFVIEMVKLV